MDVYLNESCYKPLWSSSTVSLYRVMNLSYRNCEIMELLPTRAEPMTTTRRCSLLAAQLAPLLVLSVPSDGSLIRSQWPGMVWGQNRTLPLTGNTTRPATNTLSAQHNGCLFHSLSPAVAWLPNRTLALAALLALLLVLSVPSNGNLNRSQ